MDYLQIQSIRCGLCGIITVWIYHIIHLAQGLSDIRKPDMLFRNKTWVSDRLVTCGPRPPGERVFPSDTWSCYDIRIDGDYLRYHYLPGYGANTEYCNDLKHKDENNQTIKYMNDVAALCRYMLKLHKIDQLLWAAMVSNTSCDVTLTERLLFVKRGGSHEWMTYPAGSGYVNTLQCMLVET